VEYIKGDGVRNSIAFKGYKPLKGKPLLRKGGCSGTTNFNQKKKWVCSSTDQVLDFTSSSFINLRIIRDLHGR